MANTVQITFILSILGLLIQQIVTGSCSYNPNCYHKCYNKECEYDPSTNSFYNSSITNRSIGYHGPGCCGCVAPYYWDHLYDPVSKDCIQRSCGKDVYGTQLFWINDFFGYCDYQCRSWAPYRNYQTGRCQYTCSNGYFRDYYVTMCVETCQNGTYGHKNQYSNFCDYSCYSPYFKNNYTKMCEQQCSGDYFGLESTRQCLLQCPYLDFKHFPTKTCVQNCPDGYYKSRATNSCVSNCYTQGQKRFYNNQTGRCETFCPFGMSGNTTTGFCQTSNGRCPSGLFKLESAHKCVTNCSLAAPSSPTPNAIYADSISMQCVNYSGCSYDFSSNTQTYSENSSMSCVRFCGYYSYKHPQAKACTSMCYGNYPIGYYHQDGNRTCQTQSRINVEYKQDLGDYVKKTTVIILTVVILALILIIIVIAVVVYMKKIKDKPIPQLNIQQTSQLIEMTQNPTFNHLN